jgi:hypothetical protein
VFLSVIEEEGAIHRYLILDARELSSDLLPFQVME